MGSWVQYGSLRIDEEMHEMKSIGNPRRRNSVLRKLKTLTRRHLSADGRVTDKTIPVRVVPISTGTDKEGAVV